MQENAEFAARVCLVRIAPLFFWMIFVQPDCPVVQYAWVPSIALNSRAPLAWSGRMQLDFPLSDKCNIMWLHLRCGCDGGLGRIVSYTTSSSAERNGKRNIAIYIYNLVSVRGVESWLWEGADRKCAIISSISTDATAKREITFVSRIPCVLCVW